MTLLIKKALPNDFKVALPPLHENQRKVEAVNTRFKVVAAGRRFGKSLYAKHVLMDLAINQGKTVWFISPTYNNVMVHWRETKRMLGDIPTYRSEQQKYLEFARADGRVGSISFKSGNAPDNLLGSGLDFVVIDEAAYQDEELWVRVVRPSLSDRKGGALLISTPNGTVNWFYAAYMAGIDPDNKEWSSFRFATVDNPYIDPDEIENARSELPDLKFRQEYLAEFVSDAGGVFRGVEEVAIVEPLKEPDPARHYFAGIDWGRKNDFTVISIFDDQGNQVAIDRFTEIGWQIQKNRVQSLYRKWKFVRMYIEANGAGAPVIEDLVSMGLPIEPVYMTNPLKVALVEQLSANIEKKDIRLLTTKTTVGNLQVGELLSFSIERSKNGINVTYSAPKGWHDDIVIATMLVNQVFVKKRSNKISAIENPFYTGRYVLR